MSKSLNLYAAAGLATVGIFVGALNFADRNIADVPADVPVMTLGEASPDFAIIKAARAMPVPSEGPLGIGRVAADVEIAAWDIDVRPDGVGLPEGSGDVLTGEEVFIEKCAVCHGDFGEGVDRWPVLTGGMGSLTNDRPVKTTGSYWPYLSTVWDYIHRAMPFGAAQTLTNDEVYAIVAYLMYMNDMVDDEFVLSRDNFLDVPMNNADGFYFDDRDQVEVPAFTKADVCMENCKPTVEIAARAVIVDVTPEAEEGPLTFGAPAGGHGEMKTAEAAPAAAEETVADAGAIDMALAAEGEKVFKKCRSCHVVDKEQNKSGPHLVNVYGRAIGGVDGFKYSKTLAEMGGVWNDETLVGFLKDPRGYAKGTKMSFKGLKDDDAIAMTEYLKSLAQ